MPGELGNKVNETEMMPNRALHSEPGHRAVVAIHAPCGPGRCAWVAGEKCPKQDGQTANTALERNPTSALLVHCTKKVNDHLIFPRPLGVCPSAFAIACSDIILTTSVRYAAICLFYRACSIATITGSPPFYRLFTITREKGVMATVHDHDGKRVRTMIFFQVLAPDSHRTRCNRRWNMFGTIHKRYAHCSSPAIRMTG